MTKKTGKPCGKANCRRKASKSEGATPASTGTVTTTPTPKAEDQPNTLHAQPIGAAELAAALNNVIANGLPANQDTAVSAKKTAATSTTPGTPSAAPARTEAQQGSADPVAPVMHDWTIQVGHYVAPQPLTTQPVMLIVPMETGDQESNGAVGATNQPGAAMQSAIDQSTARSPQRPVAAPPSTGTAPVNLVKQSMAKAHSKPAGNKNNDKVATRCVCCHSNDGHTLVGCDEFMAWSLQTRRLFVRDQKLCPRCIREHPKSTCHMGKCKKCIGKSPDDFHSPLLCPLQEDRYTPIRKQMAEAQALVDDIERRGYATVLHDRYEAQKKEEEAKPKVRSVVVQPQQATAREPLAGPSGLARPPPIRSPTPRRDFYNSDSSEDESRYAAQAAATRTVAIQYRNENYHRASSIARGYQRESSPENWCASPTYGYRSDTMYQSYSRAAMPACGGHQRHASQRYDPRLPGYYQVEVQPQQYRGQSPPLHRRRRRSSSPPEEHYGRRASSPRRRDGRDTEYERRRR